MNEVARLGRNLLALLLMLALLTLFALLAWSLSEMLPCLACQSH